MVVPVDLELGHPVLHPAQRGKVQAPLASASAAAQLRQTNLAHPAALFVRDETSAFQDAQMLVDGGQGDAEVRGELAHGSFAAGQPLEHSPPGRIAQGEKSGVERLSLTFSHVGKY